MADDAVPVSEEQRIIIRERLRILAIAAYVRGGITAAFSCFFLIYAIFLLSFSFIPDSAWNNPRPTPSPGATWESSSRTPAAVPPNNAPPKIFFRIMAGAMGGLVLLGCSIGGLTAYSGRCIQKRRQKVLVYVMAAFNCLFLPYGTLYGIFAILVLSSPAAKLEFAES